MIGCYILSMCVCIYEEHACSLRYCEVFWTWVRSLRGALMKNGVYVLRSRSLVSYHSMRIKGVTSVYVDISDGE